MRDRSPVANARGRPADEQSPLLGEQIAKPVDQENADIDDDERPLEKTQILLLSFARLIDPISYFCIFPFVNQMLYEVGHLHEADVGFYSGLVESLFSVVQMFCMIPWGYASDRYGRKPVLISSMTLLTIATTAFGFSRTIWEMILWRCIAGAFSANVLTIRVMVTEISTPKTQAQAFSYYSAMFTIGIIVGPIIGGLAKPATEYPYLFGDVQFLKKFPYALPTIVSGLIGALTTLITIFFIKETLHSRLRTKTKASKSPAMSMWDIVRSPGVSMVTFYYGHLMLVAFAFTALFPVLAFTEISLGGFGFSPKFISAFLVTAALLQVFWIVLVFPPLCRKIGIKALLCVTSIAWAFTLVWPPICNILLRKGQVEAFWISSTLIVLQWTGSSMGFVAVQLAVNNISPSPAALGLLNAVIISLTSFVRSFAPGLSTTIFAIGIKKQILGGHLVWVIMAMIAVGLAFAARRLPIAVDGNKARDATTDEVE